MVKLKKYSVKLIQCPTCKGNGFVKIIKENKETYINQCWDCDSEGEFYVHKPEISIASDHVDPVTGDVFKLN
jgi:DnaJ-class molecular chaperone|tara:strand:+ start:1379 stop:1594 length:216 start_codon:yes stop_codon:yes gene_type:complete